MITKINLEQAARAIAVCCAANIPVALWGPVGVGKSAVTKQVAEKSKLRLFDFRLSDKEPSDLGGIPYPVDGKLRYLVTDNLPLDSDEKAIVFLDEFDRCDVAVMNV